MLARGGLPSVGGTKPDTSRGSKVVVKVKRKGEAWQKGSVPYQHLALGKKKLFAKTPPHHTAERTHNSAALTDKQRRGEEKTGRLVSTRPHRRGLAG